MGRGQAITYAPVGDSLQNGQDLGGARIYPFSAGLAITPPAYYGDYIGSGTGLPVTPPASALSGTAGASSGGSYAVQAAKADPWGPQSPLPWTIGGVVLAVAAMYAIHYRSKS
jgi:hypothetical protein